MQHLHYFAVLFFCVFWCLQCFDAVGWVEGRASGLQKTEWWGAGVVICLELDTDLGSPGQRAIEWVCVCVCI